MPGTDAAQRCGVVALDAWLSEWKEKMQNEKETDTRRASQNSWWLEDDNSEEEDDSAETTMLMYGPPGVGKSSAVFACAAARGFEVIEVNSSMVRSGAAIKVGRSRVE